MNEKINSVHFGKPEPLVVGDKVFKSANDWELSEREKEIARVELGETEEKKERCLRELKKKLSKDNNFNYSTDDAFLLRYLSARKYNVDSAYERIKVYYDLKTKHPDLFVPRRDLMDLQNLGIFQYLPYADEEGRSICWLNIAQWNPTVVSVPEVSAYGVTICEQVSRNPKSQINGVVAVWDTDGINTQLFTELLRGNALFLIAKFLQVAMPWRIKKLIFLNTGKIVRILVKMCYPFLSRKLTERMIFLGSDLTELHQNINPAILPKKLGGLLEDDECRVPKHIIDEIETLD